MSENPTVVDFVIDYLRANPDFLLRHPELFLHLSLPGQAPDGSRTPAECQNEALKAALSSCQIKEEERRLRESSLSSDAKSEEIIRFATDLLACHSQVELPNLVLSFFISEFRAAHGLLRLWPVKANFSFFPFAERLGPDVEAALDSIENFYLGENYGDEVAHWLKIDPVETRGVLILPLRGHTGAVFGMICLCDADEKKFTQGTSPKFLKMAAKVAETALTPLIN